MKVIATQKGYFGGAIRNPGDEFSIENKSQLGHWMKPADTDDAADLAPAEKPLTKMSKAELVARAEGIGVRVSPDSMTNKEIIAAIEAGPVPTDESSVM